MPLRMQTTDVQTLYEIGAARTARPSGTCGLAFRIAASHVPTQPANAVDVACHS